LPGTLGRRHHDREGPGRLLPVAARNGGCPGSSAYCAGYHAGAGPLYGGHPGVLVDRGTGDLPVCLDGDVGLHHRGVGRDPLRCARHSRSHVAAWQVVAEGLCAPGHVCVCIAVCLLRHRLCKIRLHPDIGDDAGQPASDLYNGAVWAIFALFRFWQAVQEYRHSLGRHAA